MLNDVKWVVGVIECKIDFFTWLGVEVRHV